MSAKTLDQSVFVGLPVEYRWAVVNKFGGANALNFDPKLIEVGGDVYWDILVSGGRRCLGNGYDTTDWQNSLIERQDVPTAADIDWSRQDVPAGATHFMQHPTALSFYRSGGDVWEGYHSKKREWYVLKNTGDFFYENLLEMPLTKPTPQVDWSAAPAGATHYNTSSGAFFKRLDSGLVQVFAKTAGEWASLGAYTVFDLESSTCTVKRPESIHDVARSIEAARVAEKSGNRCATCTANICSVIDDCYAQRAKEESARIEERACMPWPDGDPRYFETSDCYESLAVKVCADQPAAQVIDPPVLGNQSGRDAVNNPAHYTTGGIECIDAMQAMLSREEFIGYLRGNIFKYQWRYKHKNGVEDLRKADWYAQRLIRVEGEK